MFYTTIAGWMILYFVKMATGQFDGLNSDQVGEAFSHMLGQPVLMTVFMAIAVLLCFRHLCKRSSERCGAYHKSDDGMSALPDGRSGSSFRSCFRADRKDCGSICMPDFGNVKEAGDR